MKTYIDEVVDKVANKLTEINSPYLLRVYALLVLTKGENAIADKIENLSLEGKKKKIIMEI